MSRSLKLQNDNYLDISSIVYNQVPLINMLTFSTEEHIVGTWFDKPLYMKSFTGTLSWGGNFKISLSSLNIKTVMFDYAHTFLQSSAGIVYPFPYHYGNSSDICTSCEIANNYISGSGKGSAYSSGTYYITILYTKTTD